MAKTTKEAKPGNSGANGSAAAQLTEIRNLLFAEAMAELREQMDAGFADLTRRLEQSEQALKEQVVHLSERVDSQVERLQQVLADENKKLADAGTELKNELDAVGEDLKQTRSWVEAEHESIYGELSDRHSDAIKQIDKVADELEDKKADRAALASLFSTFVSQLSQGSLGDSEADQP